MVSLVQVLLDHLKPKSAIATASHNRCLLQGAFAAPSHRMMEAYRAKPFMSARGKNSTPMTSNSKLRVIGGDWRGRTLRFTAKDGLRPTTDRVRETLFNWLAPRVGGARCLDMFAGSGALGLEALSRGAKSCDFVESQRTAAQAIQGHLALLQATTRGHVINTDALAFTGGYQYDIVFIDPPFADHLQQKALMWLLDNNMLTDDARIYLEFNNKDPEPCIDARVRVLRDKKAGQVRYQLLAVSV